MILSIIGTVGTRIVWIFWIFPQNRSLYTLFISYPASWAITIVMPGDLLHLRKADGTWTAEKECGVKRLRECCRVAAIGYMILQKDCSWLHLRLRGGALGSFFYFALERELTEYLNVTIIT